VELLKRFDQHEEQRGKGSPFEINIDVAKERIEATLRQEIITWLPERVSRAGLQISLIGLHCE
jgi:PIN domain nuclease of toxin-antitoxin system